MGKAGRAAELIPLNPRLRDALQALYAQQAEKEDVEPDDSVIASERSRRMSAGLVTVWFHRLYAGLGLADCSSHSGQPTFITRGAKKITEAGGSLRDITAVGRACESRHHPALH